MARENDTSRAERKAVAAHKAVKKYKRQQKLRRSGLGCLAMIVWSVLFVWWCAPEETWEGAVEEIRSGGRTPSEPLPSVHGDFRARPFRPGEAKGTVVLGAWSTERGADEQVSFTLNEQGGYYQCQYWSVKLENHLTEVRPDPEACRMERGKTQADGSIAVRFSMRPHSLKEGRKRAVSGRLIFSAELAKRMRARGKEK